MSSAATYVRLLKKYDDAPQLTGYTRVVLTVSENAEYTAGTDTGRTLYVTNPLGSQALANDILGRILGYQYKPYSAAGAILDPAAELGDGITANGAYGGIYSLQNHFGGLFAADVSAPCDEEIDHEYPYKSPQQRQILRAKAELTARLEVQAGLISAEVAERKSDVESINGKLSVQSDMIAAKVSRTGGEAASFGWNLTDTDWTIQANGSDVLKATRSGLEVYGKITATSGKIGGFDIDASSLSYNSQTWGGTNTKGIYLGPDGIQLGKNFKVDSAGNLSAASGTFSGNVYAKYIQYGDDYGTLSGAALTGGSIYEGKIAAGTLTTGRMSAGINTSLGYADYANGVFAGWNKAPYVKTAALIVGSTQFTKQTIAFIDGSGNTRSFTVLAEARE